MSVTNKSPTKEKEEKTGKLDLGRCGLTELPEELFELEWLEELMTSGLCTRPVKDKKGKVAKKKDGSVANRRVCATVKLERIQPVVGLSMFAAVTGCWGAWGAQQQDSQQ